jgi:transposase
MYRKPGPRQETCFIPGSLTDYVPEEHILKQVHAVLDLSWLAEEVQDLYAEVGRPCLDPERAVRLMLAGFFHGVVQDRALLREAQVNLAYRWFAGYALDEPLPDHSTLTYLRQRWGEARFRRIFERSVTHCVQAGLVGGRTTHVDASLIRADVSWSSLVPEHVARVLAENETPEEPAPPPSSKKVSTTDPEASLAKSQATQRLEPSYKQHIAVDDQAGVIVDVAVTTGEASESRELLPQLARVAAQTGALPQVVTADRAYATSDTYATLEARAVAAVIPPPREVSRTGMPLRRFGYDARHDRVRCPAGRHLLRGSRGAHGWFYRARPRDCQRCPRRARCVPPTAQARSVLITDGHAALLRARRCKARGWPTAFTQAYHRHRGLVEGVHGEAKTCHGLRRAVRRGLANMRIQAYLTATVINLKRLATAVARSWARPGDGGRRRGSRALPGRSSPPWPRRLPRRMSHCKPIIDFPGRRRNMPLFQQPQFWAVVGSPPPTASPPPAVPTPRLFASSPPYTKFSPGAMVGSGKMRPSTRPRSPVTCGVSGPPQTSRAASERPRVRASSPRRKVQVGSAPSSWVKESRSRSAWGTRWAR